MANVCPLCDKVFKQKSDLTRHIKRKNPCKKAKEETNEWQCVLCEKDFTRKYNLDRHMKKYHVEEEHVIEETYSLTDILVEDSPVSLQPQFAGIDKDKVCSYCGTVFTMRKNLLRHIRHRCKVKQKSDAEKESLLAKLIEEMEEQKAQMEELKSQIDDTSLQKINANHSFNKQVTNNSQVNNSFQLAPFGKEDINHLDDDSYKKLLKGGIESLVKLLEIYHYDINNPLYHNFFISNLRSAYALSYNGQRWNAVKTSDALDQLYDGNMLFLEEKFDELHDELDSKTIKKFSKTLDKYTNDVVSKRIKEKMKYIAYNKKHIPLATQKKMKELGLLE